MADADLMASLRAAGEIVRSRAAWLAGWSERIPESGRVESVRDNEVLVIFGDQDAPHARTYEVKGMRHPVFGTGPRKTWHWVESQWRPFLAPAAEITANEVAREVATVVDKYGRELGYLDGSRSLPM